MTTLIVCRAPAARAAMRVPRAAAVNEPRPASNNVLRVVIASSPSFLASIRYYRKHLGLGKRFNNPRVVRDIVAQHPNSAAILLRGARWIEASTRRRARFGALFLLGFS